VSSRIAFPSLEWNPQLSLSHSFESNESMVITCSTKVCSFGKQVVEKVETEYSRLENGRFVYRIHRSPMCDYMINFINKLKQLPERYMMNSVLEHFTILQVRIRWKLSEQSAKVCRSFPGNIKQRDARDAVVHRICV
jgi:hypothetical protein